MRRFGLLVGVATASAFTFPSPITQTGRVKVASLQMSTQPAPAEKPGFESPKAKLNALAANEKTWGIVTGGETSSPATTTAPSRKWMKVEKKWIDRPKSTAMFPANILAANVPGPFNGGGWAVDKSTDGHSITDEGFSHLDGVGHSLDPALHLHRHIPILPLDGRCQR